MSPLWISFLTGFIVLFSFQNCQKNLFHDEAHLQISNGAVSLNPNKILLSDQNIKEIYFFSRENENLVKNGNSFTVVTNKTYEIDLESDQIFVGSDFSKTQKTYCLSGELKTELIQILKSSSICKSQKEQNSDRVCSQVMKAAYSRIVTSSDNYELGAASDSCGSNSVDLCGDEPLLLKGYLAHLQAKLQDLNCK